MDKASIGDLKRRYEKQSRKDGRTVRDNENKKRKNKGFTLVEVLVAAAILSILVPPILSSFVAIARVNAKSRRKLSATTIANGVMESVKGFELSQVARQCDFPSSGCYVVAGFSGTASEVLFSDLTTTTHSVTQNGSEYNFDGQTSGNYAFKFVGVEMDGTTYDVLLTYKKNATNTKSEVVVEKTDGSTETKTTEAILGAVAIRVLTYYDVDIKVFRGGQSMTSTPLVHITGTKADYN